MIVNSLIHRFTLCVFPADLLVNLCCDSIEIFTYVLAFSYKMVVWPAMILGGLGMSHHIATKELDTISRESERPIFGFWSGITVGGLLGLWMGANFSGFFLHVFSLFDWLLGSDNFLEDEKNDKNGEHMYILILCDMSSTA